MIESAGFFLPRMIRETVGSREMEESPGEMRMALLLTIGVYGPILIPMTVGLAPAAVSIRTGRKVKHGLKRLKKKMRGEGAGTTAGEPKSE